MEKDENFFIEDSRYSEKKDFTTLECWKKCRDVKIYFYKKVIPKLPKAERYNLEIQIKKAAISATANIACPMK